VIDEYVLARIQTIQQELEDLRKVIARQVAASKRETRLEGLWEGVQITDAELEEAQRSVFKFQ
jgi:hypothetical protein